MDLVKNLHTAIRRYCLDKSFYWSEKYSELLSTEKSRAEYGYSNEALYTFPRYNVLNAVVFEIERFRPEEFKSLEEAKTFFKLIANEAQSILTKPPNEEIAEKAMFEEREKLCRFIDEQNEQDLLLVEPLFYRRVLSDKESKIIREQLDNRWKIPKHYWYPLTTEKPENVEAFQDAYFEKEIGKEKLQEILYKHGIEKVFEIREDGLDYEFELSIFNPYYNGAEGFWCDTNYDWIIYASHESSITIGGWLLDEVKAVWTNWEERIWTTPFFD